MNKIGVLVLVVGIGFFIRYSLLELGPIGRILIGYGSSGLMFGIGFFLVGKSLYRIIGGGLMGGGWAAAYFTTYAIHAIPAARLIENPVLGFLLLLGVAGCILVHALKYRSEALLMLAYAVGYLTLLIGSAPLYASFATLPLLLTLLWVAFRREWHRLSLAGVVFTYGAFLLLLKLNESQGMIWEELFTSLGFLAAYWALFEGFDLLRVRRAALKGISERTLSPLNNVLWLGASLALWNAVMPIFLPFDPSNVILVPVATLFLASAVLRARCCPISRYRTTASTSFDFKRVMRESTAGGYEISLVLSTILFLVSAWRLTDGLTLILALVIEGQALFLGGILFREPLVRNLGFMVLSISLMRTLTWDLYQAKPITRLGVDFSDWAMKGWVMMVVAFCNRKVLLRQASHPSQWVQIHSVIGTSLLALVIWNVLPAPLVAPVWGGVALILLELGYAKGDPFWRLQGHALAVAAFARLFFANFTNFGFTGIVSHRFLLVAPVVVLLFYLPWRMRNARESSEKQSPEDFPSYEEWLRVAYLYLATIATTFLLRFELGRVAVVTGWALLMLVMVHFSNRFRNKHFLIQGFALGALVFARAWATNFYIPENLFGVFGRVGVGVSTALTFFVAYFLLPRQPVNPKVHSKKGYGRLLIWFQRNGRALFVLGGSSMLALLFFYEVPGKLLTLVWGLEALVLLLLGFVLRQQLWRLSGLLLLGVSVGKLFLYDLRGLDTPYRIASFIMLGLFMIGASGAYARFSSRLKPSAEPSTESADPPPPSGRT